MKAACGLYLITDSNNKFTSGCRQLSMASSTPQAPIPSMSYDMHIDVDLNPKISVGAGPWGIRNWISFTGGRWTAEWGRGTVEVRSPLVAEATLLLLTDLTWKARRTRLTDSAARFVCKDRYQLPFEDRRRFFCLYLYKDERVAYWTS